MNNLQNFDESNLKAAVIVPTYKRSNGETPENLRKMFKMLDEQTFREFKLYLIGDNYADNNEFESLCSEYKGNIYFHNNPTSFRELHFSKKSEYWECGGTKAVKVGVEKCKSDDIDIIFMLDDDDYWLPTHMEKIMTTYKKFPETAHVLSHSKYFKNYILPCSFPELKYNNYVPRERDIVRSATSYNLNLAYNTLIEFWSWYIELVINNNCPGPQDACCHNWFGKCNRDNAKIKCILIPDITVVKESDQNFPC